jgi:hypothetical protein
MLALRERPKVGSAELITIGGGQEERETQKERTKDGGGDYDWNRQ